MMPCFNYSYFITFYSTDSTTTEIYTLSLHDALPILWKRSLRELPFLYNDSPDHRNKNHIHPLYRHNRDFSQIPPEKVPPVGLFYLRHQPSHCCPDLHKTRMVLLTF